MKTFLRRFIKWGLFGLPLSMMVAFGFVVLFPFFALMDWLDDEPGPVTGAWNDMMGHAKEIYGSLA